MKGRESERERESKRGKGDGRVAFRYYQVEYFKSVDTNHLA